AGGSTPSRLRSSTVAEAFPGWAAVFSVPDPANFPRSILTRSFSSSFSTYGVFEMLMRPPAVMPKADGEGSPPSCAIAAGANSAEPTSAAEAALAPRPPNRFLDNEFTFQECRTVGGSTKPALRSLDDVHDGAEREFYQFVQGGRGHADAPIAVPLTQETVVGPGVDPDRAGTTAICRQAAGMGGQRQDHRTVVGFLFLHRRYDVRAPRRCRMLLLADPNGVLMGFLILVEGRDRKVTQVDLGPVLVLGRLHIVLRGVDPAGRTVRSCREQDLGPVVLPVDHWHPGRRVELLLGQLRDRLTAD